MTKTPCGAELERGGTCQAFALPSGRCWNHAPERADERRQARAKGGQMTALKGQRLRLDTSAAVVKYLAGITQDIVAERLDAKIASTVVYALSVQLKAIEMAEAAEGRKLLHQVEQLTRQARRQP